MLKHAGVEPPAQSRAGWSRRGFLISGLVDFMVFVAFVRLGGRSHDLHAGPDWFVLVLWPLVAGWFAVALLVRLYVRPQPAWIWLGLVWIFGIGLGLILRVTLTGRAAPLPFVIVAFAFTGLAVFGWRVLVQIYLKFRGNTPERT